jgi:hypothetical protein
MKVGKMSVLAWRANTRQVPDFKDLQMDLGSVQTGTFSLDNNFAQHVNSFFPLLLAFPAFSASDFQQPRSSLIPLRWATGGGGGCGATAPRTL